MFIWLAVLLTGIVLLFTNLFASLHPDPLPHYFVSIHSVAICYKIIVQSLYILRGSTQNNVRQGV